MCNRSGGYCFVHVQAVASYMFINCKCLFKHMHSYRYAI